MCLAVPGKVIAVHPGDDFTRSGKVDFGGLAREVNLSLVPEAGVGDYVIVHVGVALSRLDADEAQQVFAYLEQLGEIAEMAG